MARSTWVCTALALIACSNSATKPESTGSAGSGSAGSAGSAEGAMTPSVRHYTPEGVRMVAPPIELPKQEAFIVREVGKGEKVQLRYALAAGAGEVHTETKLATRSLDKGKFGAPVKLPALKDGFAVTIADGQPVAMRALVAEIAGGKADSVAEQYLASWRTKLQNRRITVATDPRGEFSKITFLDDPGDQRSGAAKDELVQRLLATMVPMPEVAIATGAKWQVTTVLRQGPLYIKQTGTYTLLARTPAKWKVHVKLLRVGEEQSVADPTLPKGASVDLIALFRLLEGDVEIDPKRPFVTAGTLTVESRLHVKVKLAGRDAEEQFTEDTGTITLSSRP